MKILPRLLWGLGTVLLLALTLQLCAPPAVHAVVSTLVTVANTAANPVGSRNVDNPATYPYSANLCIGFNGGHCDPSTPQVFVVPANTSTGLPVKRLVLQAVSGSCQGDPATIALLDGVQINSFAPPDTINPSSRVFHTYQSALVFGTSRLSGDFPSLARFTFTRPPETPCIPTYSTVLKPSSRRGLCSARYSSPATWLLNSRLSIMLRPGSVIVKLWRSNEASNSKFQRTTKPNKGRLSLTLTVFRKTSRSNEIERKPNWRGKPPGIGVFSSESRWVSCWR